jgi:hypothetical protein
MPPATMPNTTKNPPIAARTGAQDGPGMWMPSGVTGSIRRLPRRFGPAVANR